MKLSLSIPICTLKAARIDVAKRTVTLSFEASLTPELLRAERRIWQLATDHLLSLDVETVQDALDIDDEQPSPRRIQVESLEDMPNFEEIP